MGVLDQLQTYYEDHDRILAFSAAGVRQMYADRVEPIAAEIAGFLDARGVGLEEAARRYKVRNDELAILQREFERTGRYPASRYEEVAPVDGDAYNLGLLLSFVLTIHRFEILQDLLRFLDRGPCETRSLLAIGYGTGYELKWARERLPDWELAAYDSSPDARAYASNLLRHFGHDDAFLRTELFPLESDEGLDAHRRRYGKVILCELLEHLEDPGHALRNVGEILAPGGEAFLTMAVNIAQEDHVHLCASAGAFRDQVEGAGLEIVEEHLAPVTVFPIAEADRAAAFRKGNVVCVARTAGSG